MSTGPQEFAQPNPPRARLAHQLHSVLAFFICFFAFIAFIKVFWPWLTVAHWPRVAASVGLFAAGLFLPLFFARPTLWQRLTCGSAGVILALAAWWLVPVTTGSNLLSANNGVVAAEAQLASLRPDDHAGFRSGSAERQTLAAEFPQFRHRLVAAENTWLARVGKGERDPQRLRTALTELGASPNHALDRESVGGAFQRCGGQFVQVEHDMLQQQLLAAAKQLNVDADVTPLLDMVKTIDADVALVSVASLPLSAAAIEPLHSIRRQLYAVVVQLRNEQMKTAVAKLDADPTGVIPVRSLVISLDADAVKFPGIEVRDIREQVFEVRKRAFVTRLDSLRKQARSLLLRERYQAAEQAARTACEQLGDEASYLGRASELASIRESYSYFAELARIAGQADPP